MVADIDETIIMQWNKNLQKAITVGKGAVEEEVKSGINQNYNLGFSIIEISEEFLTKILKKEYKEYDRKSVDFESYLINESKGRKDASILVRSVQDNDEYKRETLSHYIYAIYLNDLKI